MPPAYLSKRHTTIRSAQGHAQLECEAGEQARREAIRAAHREEDLERGRHRAEALGEMSGGKLDESGHRGGTGADGDAGFTTLAPCVYRREKFRLTRQVHVMCASRCAGVEQRSWVVGI